MKLLGFLVARGWQQNKLRTVLTVLGIAFGVAIVTAIHVMDYNTVQSRIMARNPEGGGVDYELTPRSRAELDATDERRRLLALDGVSAAAVVDETVSRLVVGEKDVGAVTLLGIGPLPSVAFDHYSLLHGQDLGVLDGERAVLVGQALAMRVGLQLGDLIRLEPARSAPRKRCVDGERVDREAAEHQDGSPVITQVQGILAPRQLGGRNAGEVIIANYSLARRVSPGHPPTYHIAATYGADRDALQAELRKGFQVQGESSALLGDTADERAFRNGVKVLGGLALVLGMFVVFQTLSQSLVERLRQIGLLRCLGTSSRTVGGVFLLDALALATCGVLLGIGMGLALAWVLQQVGFSSLGVGHGWEIHEIPLRPLLWTALLGLLFTLAGAAFPLWRARRLSPIQVLHARGMGGDSQDVLKGVNRFLFLLVAVLLPTGYLGMTTILSASDRETLIVLLQLGGLILVFGAVLLLTPGLVRLLGSLMLWPVGRLSPLPVFLVRKSLRRQTGRIAASVCGLGIVLVAAIALESMTSALREEAREFGRTAMADTMFVRGQAKSFDEALQLGELEGVRRVEPLFGPVAAPFLVSGLRAGFLTADGGLLADDPVAAEDYATRRTLIVSDRLARLRQFRVGESVKLITDGGEVEYRVLKISDRAGYFPDDRAYALCDPRWLEQDFCVDQVERIILRMEPESWTQDLWRRARELQPDLEFSKTGDAIVDYLVRDTTRDFTLFQVLLLMILALAGLGLVNAMTIAALGRIREIGVLRALGTSSKQLRSALLVEGLLTGGLAAGVALALGIPLGRLIVRGMNEVAGIDAPYVLPWHAVIAVPILALAVGVLAAVLPGLRVARIRAADAVRFE